MSPFRVEDIESYFWSLVGVSELKVTSGHPLACTFANKHTTLKRKHSFQSVSPKRFITILNPFWNYYTQTLIMMYFFAWQTISNYLTPPPQIISWSLSFPNPLVIPHAVVITSVHRYHSGAWLPLVNFHTEEITSGHPHTEVTISGHPQTDVVISGHPYKVVTISGQHSHNSDSSSYPSHSINYVWSLLTQ